MGRPRIELTDAQIKEIEKLAAYLTQEQIADVLGFSDRTLRNRMTEDERVAAAYARGRARAVARVGKTLLEQADDGNVRAIEFYLKSQAGWKETQGFEIDGSIRVQWEHA